MGATQISESPPSGRGNRAAITTRDAKAGGGLGIDTLPQHGPLVEMTVIQTGPILDTKRQTEKEASSATQTVQAEAKSATVVKTSYWPPWWLWGVIVVVGIALFATIRLGLKLPFGL